MEALIHASIVCAIDITLVNLEILTLSIYSSTVLARCGVKSKTAQLICSSLFDPSKGQCVVACHFSTHIDGTLPSISFASEHREKTHRTSTTAHRPPWTVSTAFLSVESTWSVLVTVAPHALPAAAAIPG